MIKICKRSSLIVWKWHSGSGIVYILFIPIHALAMAVKHGENDDDIIFILKFSCLYSKIEYAILETAYLVKEANKINS